MINGFFFFVCDSGERFFVLFLSKWKLLAVQKSKCIFIVNSESFSAFYLICYHLCRSLEHGGKKIEAGGSFCLDWTILCERRARTRAHARGNLADYFNIKCLKGLMRHCKLFLLLLYCTPRD